jgi:NAD(P)-dependent dehydrogenase (short-subunit alcohol dehydrogenase family)
MINSRIKVLQDMSGKLVVLTGATGHLGVIIAETIVDLGGSMILVDRPGSPFCDVKKNLEIQGKTEISYFECDFEDEKQRKNLIELISSKYDRIDCLIHNAAFVGTSNLQGWTEPFESQSIDTWRRAIEVNLTSVFHISQGLYDKLKKARGNIVNITSIYAEHAPDWSLYEGTNLGNPAAYSISKAGLAQLTRWMATTLAPEVRVNGIAPGGISRNQSNLFMKRYEAKTPMGRMAVEDDFRGAVAYLSSNLSQYVTGQIIKVDGGWGLS